MQNVFEKDMKTDKNEFLSLANLEKQINQKAIDRYNKEKEIENDYYSLELVQSFSYRAILSEYYNFNDDYPFVGFRRIIIFTKR